MTMLEVACRRCERRGRLRIERLIAEHGSGVLDLRAIIAADCPRMRNPSASMCDRCGVEFPELPRWFLTWRAEVTHPDCQARGDVGPVAFDALVKVWPMFSEASQDAFGAGADVTERAAIVRCRSQLRGKVHVFEGMTMPVRRKVRRSAVPVGAPT